MVGGQTSRGDEGPNALPRPLQTSGGIRFHSEVRRHEDASVPVDDLVKIRSGSEGHGMVFVKEAVNAHEIGTKQSGEVILTGRK